MRKIFLALLTLTLCLFFAVAVYAEEAKPAGQKNIDLEQPIEVITAAEMEQRLSKDSHSDILYVKINNDRVEVYTNISCDRSIRKQIILTTPNEEMLRLYSNNRETALQMSRMLTDYEKDNININGYRIITDMDRPKNIQNGQRIYRLWFMKIQREKESRRNSPIGIGIGIGIGRHHDGPYIDIAL